MNLIEQLGGYEKAKEYLVELQRTPMHEQTEDTISYLPDALLEYRRQHNIFEVGDWVIPIFQPADEYFHVVKIERIGKHGGLYDSSWRLLSIDKFRHATDEEIKAGKRLEAS